MYICKISADVRVAMWFPAKVLTVVRIHLRTLKESDMFIIYLLGYGDESVGKIANFKESGENFMTVFTPYTYGDFRVGDTIKTGDPNPMYLNIVDTFLGFGNNGCEVPIGYKSVLLLEGDAEDIITLKSRMIEISRWGEAIDDNTVGAFVINK